MKLYQKNIPLKLLMTLLILLIQKIKRLFNHKSIDYDILVVSPGVEFNYDSIPEFKKNKESVPLHAWKAGKQTIDLKKQL